jgi:hypothetical protein
VETAGGAVGAEPEGAVVMMGGADGMAMKNVDG